MKDIGSNIRLFADDTCVYIIVDPGAAAGLLNLDLDKITKWAKEWRVKLNPNETKYLLISRKSNCPFHPPLCFARSTNNWSWVTQTSWNLSFEWLHMAQTHRIYLGKSREQDNCNEETKVWTRSANPKNNLFNLHSTGWNHKLTLFYKMYTNQTSPYLSTLVPPSVNTLSEYSSGNSNGTQIVHARPTLYYNSSLPQLIENGNNYHQWAEIFF